MNSERRLLLKEIVAQLEQAEEKVRKIWVEEEESYETRKVNAVFADLWPRARLPSLSFLRNRSPRARTKKVRSVAAVHYRKCSESAPVPTEAGAGNRRVEWRAADRKCASRCGHSSSRAGRPGVAFVGALRRHIDEHGRAPTSGVGGMDGARAGRVIARKRDPQRGRS
jgi:hypothetical protein